MNKKGTQGKFSTKKSVYSEKKSYIIRGKKKEASCKRVISQFFQIEKSKKGGLKAGIAL